MPCQDRQDYDELPTFGTELSAQCKFGDPQQDTTVPAGASIVAPLFCKATGQLLANLMSVWLQSGHAAGRKPYIGHNYIRRWDKAKRPFCTVCITATQHHRAWVGQYEGERR